MAAIFRDPGFCGALKSALMGSGLGYTVRVRTGLIHSKPMVTFSCTGRRKRCELGDGAVIYRERLRVGQARTQAVVFQAKKWLPRERRVATDPKQWALYKHWPPFEIQGTHRPRTPIRLPPGDYGRVLGIRASSKAADTPKVSRAIATQPHCVVGGVHREPLVRNIGVVLRDLIRFEAGERVAGEWARVVEDIIGRVFPSSVSPSFSPPGPRGVLSFMAVLESELERIMAGDGGDTPHEQVTSEAEPGFAIVLIEAAAE